MTSPKEKKPGPIEKKPGPKEKTPASGQKRGAERRSAILWALRDCMIKKGYARTSLSDIASTAGMSPSHLHYYYPGKEAILHEYFANVATRIKARLDEFRTDPPAKRIDHLAKLFFSGSVITKSEIGLMLECFGAAVNDEVLRREKGDLDIWCKDYLRELLDELPGSVTESVNDATEFAYATLIGLRTTVYFDPKIELEDAHRLFHDLMLKIGGLQTSP